MNKQTYKQKEKIKPWEGRKSERKNRIRNCGLLGEARECEREWAATAAGEIGAAEYIRLEAARHRWRWVDRERIHLQKWKPLKWKEEEERLKKREKGEKASRRGNLIERDKWRKVRACWEWEGRSAARGKLQFIIIFLKN